MVAHFLSRGLISPRSPVQIQPLPPFIPSNVIASRRRGNLLVSNQGIRQNQRAYLANTSEQGISVSKAIDSGSCIIGGIGIDIGIETVEAGQGSIVV